MLIKGAIAAAAKLDVGYVGTVLRLTLLAPEIVEAVLGGRSGELALARLLEPWPVEWGAQMGVLMDHRATSHMRYRHS